MTVSITVEQNRESVPTGYQITTEVTAVEDITAYIFTHYVESESFAHVAYPYDIYNYPETRAEAIALGKDFYRSEVAVTLFPNIDTAQASAEYTMARVKHLTDTYGAATNDFVGTTTETYVEGA